MDGKVVLVAVEALNLPLSEQSRAACVFANGPQSAVGLLGQTEGPVAVVSVPLSEAEEQLLLAALGRHSRAAVLLIIRRAARGAELDVVKQGRPRQRNVQTVQLDRLEEEILSSHRDQIVQAVGAQVRDVGFNDSVARDAALHVQTEVVGERHPKIRTTVFKGGSIVRTQAQPLAEVCGSVSAAKAAIRAQHEQVVAELGQD